MISPITLGSSSKSYLSTVILGLGSACCYLLEFRLLVVSECKFRFVGNQDRFSAAWFRVDTRGQLVSFHDSSIRLAVSEAFWRLHIF